MRLIPIFIALVLCVCSASGQPTGQQTRQPDARQIGLQPVAWQEGQQAWQPAARLAGQQPEQPAARQAGRANGLSEEPVRKVILLDNGWEFRLGDSVSSSAVWEKVSIPHDWAIYGPFDRNNDLQDVAVFQNFEKAASVKTGRTGGLPYVGVGWYRRTFDVELTNDEVPGKRRSALLFDGAMSEAQVFVNGEKVCFWPYGYNSFFCDITDYITVDGKDNLLEVRLENRPQSSRWYPGAGLYRNVYLIETSKVHVPVWGTHVTTELSSDMKSASVKILTELENVEKENVIIITEILDKDGKSVAGSSEYTEVASIYDTTRKNFVAEQTFVIKDPQLWSPETPSLYTAKSSVYVRFLPGRRVPGGPMMSPSTSDNETRDPAMSPQSDNVPGGLTTSLPSNYETGNPTTSFQGGNVPRPVAAKRILSDTYSTRFGIRTIEVKPETGFYLNGQPRKFKGVCLHHDLGPLGAAVNKAAIRHQLTMLKDMGADAIRTTHNMPAPELIELCDEMGFMAIVENFDEWDVAKCQNGYHRFFDEWAELDMINMIRHYRNNPSVVMWSIGNEVPTQWKPEGYKVASFLRDICYREDPTRPVTCGMDQVDAVLGNGFAAIMDVPGFNYRTHKYLEGYEKLPQKVLLGSETASTVSSRGVYHFPVEQKADATYPDHQSSSYDLEHCSWSNVPDIDFALADDYPWTMGQFVWTGFDYLGEPSPYDTDAWPNHSSLFGIIDLASLPKDRFYLYRSIWNTEESTLHILPHWNWKGREGEATPVFVYTSYPSAELFLNGKSLGVRMKNDSTLQNRYRLMWYNVPYQSGELKVKAFDANGNPAAEKTVRTAKKPHHIELVANRTTIDADGKDLSYITVRVVDRKGNLCPLDTREIKFNVSGAGTFRAVANGDPTSLELFHLPHMHAFGGMLTAIVQSSCDSGAIVLEAKAKGLKKAKISITTTK